MKNYKQILSFTLALIMALSISVVAMATGETIGQLAFFDDFGDASETKPEEGSKIIGSYNNWIERDVYTGSGSIAIISENTIQKDGDNYVAQLKKKGHNSESNVKYQFIRQDVSFAADTEIAKLSFKMKRNDANARTMTVMLLGDAGLKGISLISDLYKNGSDASRIMDWSGTRTAATLKAADGQQTFYEVGEWYDVDITLNKSTQKVSISVEDNVVLPDYAWSNFGITSLPSAVAFGMVYYGSGNVQSSIDYTKDASYLIDDVKVTGYTSEDIAAMAEKEVDAALSKLSDVTSIATAENLILPTATDLGTTAAISWKSDNTAVLSDNGEVTQSSGAQTAKLTATATSGSITKTKVFDVTVLPSNVYFYESFNSVDTLSGDKLEGYNSWAGGTEFTGYTVDSVFTAQKEDNNYYGSLRRDKSLAIQGGYQSRFWELNKVVSAKAAESDGGQSVSFKLKRDSNSATISIALYGPKINTSSDSSAIDFKTNYHSVTLGGSSYYYPESIMNDWLDVELMYKNGGVMAYVNGNALTKADGTPMTPVLTVWNPLTKIGFYPARAAAAIDGNNPTTFMLDDVCVKTLSKDYISCVNAKDSLVFTNPIVNDLDIEDEVNGTTITLDSSDTSVILNNGEVIRPDVEGLTPVTLNVTVAKGSEKITQSYNVNVAPMYLSKITNAYIDKDSYLDTVYITNYAKLESAVVLVAVYGKNADDEYVLKGVQIADDVTYTKEKGSQTASFVENKLKVGKGDEIRVFMWNNTSSINPISKSFIHKYVEEEQE